MTSLILTKIFALTTLCFAFALFTTPILTHYLYKYKLGKNIRDDGTTPIFSNLHKDNKGTRTPGEIVIGATVVIIATGYWLFDILFKVASAQTLNFLI